MKVRRIDDGGERREGEGRRVAQQDFLDTNLNITKTCFQTAQREQIYQVFPCGADKCDRGTHLAIKRSADTL